MFANVDDRCGERKGRKPYCEKKPASGARKKEDRMDRTKSGRSSGLGKRQGLAILGRQAEGGRRKGDFRNVLHDRAFLLVGGDLGGIVKTDGVQDPDDEALLVTGVPGDRQVEGGRITVQLHFRPSHGQKMTPEILQGLESLDVGRCTDDGFLVTVDHPHDAATETVLIRFGGAAVSGDGPGFPPDRMDVPRVAAGVLPDQVGEALIGQNFFDRLHLVGPGPGIDRIDFAEVEAPQDQVHPLVVRLVDPKRHGCGRIGQTMGLGRLAGLFGADLDSPFQSPVQPCGRFWRQSAGKRTDWAVTGRKQEGCEKKRDEKDPEKGSPGKWH